MHMLFITTTYQEDGNVKNQMVYDDQHEYLTKKISREMLYHKHQTILRKKKLTQIAQFHVINHQHQYLKNEDFEKGTVYKDFNQYKKAIQKSKLK